MQRQLADEIVACLQGERTVYPYYRDRYGIGLLRHHCRRQPGQRAPIAALRRSAYAGLLEKPRIRAILAGCSHALDDAVLAASDYDAAQTAFVLTLSTWGGERRSGWHAQQTSRPGVNLVLQLNFNREHELHYRRLGEVDGLFQYYGHPIARQRSTLAWARIDLDWASGSALIEEIQTDWLRRAADLERWLLARRRAEAADDALIPYRRHQVRLRPTLDYCRLVGERYNPIWAEAMLWAAVAFLRDELGLRTIYYHSEDSGRLLKRIRWQSPPRSLYTDLPRRFCFRRGSEWPDFLLADKENRRLQRDHPGARLFRLDDGAAA
ncbi:hypothetical protein E6C76_00140 [Pseudothauera nasutitermitis]|uniref:Uncharacterized protein n=1 Tax=Pseudothauera nasutitermitis TaxID=2565930 RepID=A0A4S4B3L6_9RHOO|nr:hypothetical protein [Pseudothauera nasutitermitis]THF66841.1 hypothetical protein E6C76_00140 [Pseudothauera nasutitermitis]